MQPEYDVRLQDLAEKSIDRLMCAEVLDVEAFADLRDYLWRIAEEIKEQHVISKQVLGVVRLASVSIRTRAEYLSDVSNHIELADEFDQMLEMLIKSETSVDRSPGEPRIL